MASCSSVDLNAIKSPGSKVKVSSWICNSPPQDLSHCGVMNPMILQLYFLSPTPSVWKQGMLPFLWALKTTDSTSCVGSSKPYLSLIFCLTFLICSKKKWANAHFVNLTM